MTIIQGTVLEIGCDTARIADEEPVDCLHGKAVFGPEPFESLGIVLEPPVIVFRQGRQHLMDPQFDHPLGLRFGQFLGRESVLGQRRQPGLGREEIAGMLMALRHRAELSSRHPARLDELHELEHVTADAAAESIPTLLVEHDMEGPVRLAAVVRAVALEQAVGFMQDVSAEQFPCDHTDVDLGDPPVILPHVVLTFECHARSAPLNKNQTIRYLPAGRPFRRGADFSLAFLLEPAIYCHRVTNNENTGRNAMTNWLTLEEAAKYLKMGKSTLYNLARKGNIPAHKMGREWRFDAAELDEWLKAGK